MGKLKAEKDAIESENKKLRYDLAESKRNMEYQIKQNENLKKVMDVHGEALQNKIRDLLKDLEENKAKLLAQETFRDNLRFAEFQLKDYEGKMQMLQHEIEKQDKIIMEKNEEIKEWKEKYFKVEAQAGGIENFVNRIRKYE